MAVLVNILGVLVKSLSSIVILNIELYIRPWSFPGGSMVKNPSANAGDAGNAGLIPGWRRSPGGGHSKSLQYSCLEKPMDKGPWWATVHRVAKE